MQTPAGDCERLRTDHSRLLASVPLVPLVPLIVSLEEVVLKKWAAHSPRLLGRVEPLSLLHSRYTMSYC